MLAWSVVSLLTYKAHDYHSMLVCRLILGITEAPVSMLLGKEKNKDINVAHFRHLVRSSTLELCT